MKILIIRADNIGDFVLTTPTLSLLKEKFPEASIDVLGQKYVQFAIEACPYVRKFVDYNALLASDDPASLLKKEGYDLAIAISKHPKAVQWIKKAGIPFRIGAINRLHTWFSCNSLPWCSRFKSYPHEAQKSTQFLKPLGIAPTFALPELTKRISLSPKGELRPELRKVLAPNKFNLILHPGSNNHGREWPIRHYGALIQRLPKDKFHILITGRENEKERFAPYLPAGEYVDLMGQTSLDDLLLLLANVQGLVSSGTGTVHLAAALGIHALALFPPKYKIGPLAWQPLGPKAEYLQEGEDCRTKCRDGGCPCMDKLSVDRVLGVITSW